MIITHKLSQKRAKNANNKHFENRTKMRLYNIEGEGTLTLLKNYQNLGNPMRKIYTKRDFLIRESTEPSPRVSTAVKLQNPKITKIRQVKIANSQSRDRLMRTYIIHTQHHQSAAKTNNSLAQPQSRD